jgi:hypothetical protein
MQTEYANLQPGHDSKTLLRDRIAKYYAGKYEKVGKLICSIIEQNDGVNDTRDLGPIPTDPARGALNKELREPEQQFIARAYTTGSRQTIRQLDSVLNNRLFPRMTLAHWSVSNPWRKTSLHYIKFSACCGLWS